MESYLGISVFNKSITPGSGEVGVITDKFYIQKDKNYAISWKHINYSNASVLNAMYIIKEDGSKIKLPELNLDNFPVIETWDGRNERLLYFTYSSTFTGSVRLQIGRKQIQADREDVKVFDTRHLLFERGININEWRPKVESVSKQLIKLKTQIQQLSDSIRFSASKEDFNDLNQKIGEALSKIDIQANQIQNTVTVDNLTSYLRQDAEAIMIGFNGISDSVTITRKGIRVWHEGKGYTHMGHEEIYQTDNSAGIKLLSLYNGAYRCFRHDDGRYLGYFGSTYRIASDTGHHAYGMQIAGAYPCWYTAIGYNDKVYNPDDESMTGFKSVFEVVFFRHLHEGKMMEPGIHLRDGRFDLHHHSIYDTGIIWFDKSAYDAVYKREEDGSMIVQCEDVIRLIRNSSKNEQREGIIVDFPNNEIKMNMNINGQGYTMYNTIWQGTYAEEQVNTLRTNNESSETMKIDDIEIITIDDKLAITKSVKGNFKETLSSINEDKFDYAQIIYCLVDEVKKLKEEVQTLKGVQ